MNLKNIHPFIATSILFLSCLACAQKKENPVQSPPGYDLAQPYTVSMPSELEEISGLTFTKNNTLFSEQDEKGHLYYFQFGSKDIASVKFAGPGDYEDIAIADNRVVVLRSDGSFFSFPLQEQYPTSIESVVSEKILPKGEYESLAFSQKQRRLFALSKQSNSDKKSGKTSGFVLRVEPDGKVTEEGRFFFDHQKIKTFTGKKQQTFRPSALTKNEATDEWYILSSIDKLLVVTDASWKIRAVYPLKSKLFNQPEGIAFDGERNLYISNEAGNKSHGTILQFKYKHTSPSPSKR